MLHKHVKSQTIEQIASHFETVIAHGTAIYSGKPNPMWMASLDVRTGAYPDDVPTSGITPRVYRYTHTPGGVDLYWDQPLLVAAHALSRVIDDPRYAQAADAYVRAYLERGIASCGLFLWGNHYYYHAFHDQMVFISPPMQETPVSIHAVTAHMHEIGPIPPAWNLFWRIDPQATRRCIQAMSQLHLFDPETGGFNFHADQQRGYDLLDVGGLLVESLAWLYTRTHERALVDLALKIAHYTYDQRSPATDLLPVASTSPRWEHNTCTTEVGLWAGSLLRAAQYTDLNQFRRMARDAVTAYLDYGWDADTRQYFGRLNISDGTHQYDDSPDEKITVFQPDTYSDIWNSLYPSHDYPLALAETCVTLFEQTHLPEFRTAIWNWADIIASQTYERAPRVRYAEQFGRAIHFLLRASEALNENRYRVQAVELADVAIDALFAGRVFRGHTGEERCDAVDGVGFLLLALLYLETGHRPDYMGFGL